MDADPTTNSKNVAIGLNAVLAVVEQERPKVLCLREPDNVFSLPYGPFDPIHHRTFEIGLRDWVERQTNVTLGYVEQLYTFGDLGREAPTAALAGGNQDDRIISVGYLALAPKPADVNASHAIWRDWYDFFPWEDWRNGEPGSVSKMILPALFQWANIASDSIVRDSRLRRIRSSFGNNNTGWEEERSLDRYELMYEAGLIEEAFRETRPDAAGAKADPQIFAHTGKPMASDHRRILATAMGRLRGKLKYRPIIFRLMPARFTLLSLQKTAESVVGFNFHKQNFRRSVETGSFVDRTDETIQQASGRPAALFKVSEKVQKDRAAAGLVLPRLRAQPAFFEKTQ